MSSFLPRDAIARWSERRGEVSRVIAAPADAAWALLVDTERWTQWGPSIRAVECSTRFISAASSGRIRTVLGLWLAFDIDRFSQADRAWSWRVAGRRATGHRVEALAPDRCRVVFTVPFIAWPYRLVCARALRRIERLLTTTKAQP